jgi:hypothetical protein
MSAKLMMHSMRKSLLSALYGIYIKDGRIRLSETLANLGIDDTHTVVPSPEVGWRQVESSDTKLEIWPVCHPSPAGG